MGLESRATPHFVMLSLDDVAEFPEIGASLALSDVYYGLEFGPRLAETEET